MYMVLYQQLAKFIPRSLLRKCRRRRRLTMAYILYVEENLMMYMVLYQQLAKFILRRLLRKCRRRRRLTMAYILY
ncbi:hypothetical protein, partial [Phascolarctobacterium succinatutens]|uniref:hypothetical protein n=1 Tax=Phascolarctobacterium succinatutens TaxID=626940 RepID=UPI0023F61B97